MHRCVTHLPSTATLLVAVVLNLGAPLLASTDAAALSDAGAVPATHATARTGRYSPPVDGPVVDPFREPSGPYGPGNRGLEYATRPGGPVRAIGDGTVAFAGQVAGRLVVSIDHPDGVRSSLVGLATVAVRAGDAVRGGQVVGRAGPLLHLGVRRDGRYLDPATLFRRGAARLVPWRDGPSGSVAERRPGFGPGVAGH